MQSATEDYAESDDDEPPLLVTVALEAPAPSPLRGSDDDVRGAVSTARTTTTTSTSTSTPAAIAPSPPPCPVTILSGFLGSGKTTLVQYILQSPHHGKRIAVIENEFGDGLDVESMIARDGTSKDNASLAELIELPNGCMCCTVKDNLVVTLELLVAKRADLDYILIECSGMANPGPIASLFWLDDALESRLRLDGIVTLCDAKHIREQLSSTEEAAHQIAYADRILLNKMDLLNGDDDGDGDDASADAVVALIRAYHPTAPIRPTTYASVPDLDWLLDAHCFDTVHFQEVEESIASLQRHHEQEHEHPHDHSHDHTPENDFAECQIPVVVSHRHTSGITTIALTETGSLDWKKVNAWCAATLWPNQDATNATLNALMEQDNGTTSADSSHPAKDKHDTQRIFRMKGILAVRQSSKESDTYDESYVNDETTMLDSRRFILQAVHDLWDLYPASDELQWAPEEERTNKVIVIGKNLNEPSLREGFRACLH